MFQCSLNLEFGFYNPVHMKSFTSTALIILLPCKASRYNRTNYLLFLVLYSNVLPILISTAAQTITLCNILPYIIGSIVPPDDRKWYCLRLMLTITNFCLAWEMSSQDVMNLATLIQEHHMLFVELYGVETVTPKWHYMVHLPNQVIQ